MGVARDADLVGAPLALEAVLGAVDVLVHLGVVELGHAHKDPVRVGRLQRYRVIDWQDLKK